MSDPGTTQERIALRTPTGAWFHRWPLAVVLVLLGAVLGAGAGASVTTTYTVESRVAVGAGDLTTGAISGFPQAASSLAANYARYVNNRAKAGASKVALAASPIPESNIIRVEGQSANRADTIAEVNATAQNLVTEVNERRDGDDLLAQYKKSAAIWATALSNQNAAQRTLDRLLLAVVPRPAQVRVARAQVATATSVTSAAQLQKEALGNRYSDQQRASAAIDLQVVLPGSVVSDSHSAAIQRYALVGAVLGLALSLLVSVILERRRARRPLSSE